MTQNINQRLDWASNEALRDLPTVSADDHRSGMRHLASGVSIITSRDGETVVGLTATAVCSVTVDPPRMVVLVNKKVAAADTILASGALCINVLAASQAHLAKVFAGMVEGVFGPARFEHGNWHSRVSGAPVLEGALATFDCRVVKVFDESTHHALLCEVLHASEPPGGEPLIYVNGAFCRVSPLEA
ncbi:flavin reductase family protein [Xanthobacter versatilis]|uniref:flavin reductase family protein n=1 Tax=Xanthobacter autotrophicus (strain ATCC BAA-1158 / Py2) TaxID=78245 RepID=UPI00372B8054